MTDIVVAVIAVLAGVLMCFEGYKLFRLSLGIAGGVAGFILGKNFFVTSDDAHGGTDSQIIHDTVKIIERLFYGY